MWMLDVAAEPQLLQQPPLSLDHLVLESYVVAVQNYRLDGPAISVLLVGGDMAVLGGNFGLGCGPGTDYS